MTFGTADPMASSQTSTDGRKQRFGIDRFPENAEILCLDEIAGIAGDDDDRNVTCAAARGDLLLHEDAVETGQAEIEHHEIGRLRVDQPKRVDPVSDVVDVEACYRECRAVQVSKLGIVLDNEDSLPRTHHASMSGNDSLGRAFAPAVYAQISGHLIVTVNNGSYRNVDANTVLSALERAEVVRARLLRDGWIDGR